MDLNVLKKITISSDDTASKTDEDDVNKSDTAIIGINAQIGNAKDVEEFWELICNGCDMIRDFPAQRWEDANIFNHLKYNNQLSEELSQCSYLDRVDLFDAALFNISPTEAELMDPVQRIFLESAWAALEDSGYGGNQLNGTKTGVYLGYNNIENPYHSVIESVEDHKYGVAMSGNIDSIIASRISYLLNLKGPAINIDTACSSSLVALHLACQQIRDGEVSMALVGGIHLNILPGEVPKKKMGIESSSQRTKTFDDSADGTGLGEGVITIVLKSLQQAVRDKDNIYAVIKGSSINQDGSSVGITAPNAASQEEVIRDAWKDAQINPEKISYIEAHGTATNLGDPVEITGIERAFSHFTNRKQFCAIGSVKSNIGHLDSAAGLAGLLKVVLMLKYKKIPPTIHFNVPNRKINFMSSPVYINDKLIDWESKDTPRICGVSSFGMSGTNCHVILEELPNKYRQKETKSSRINVLTVSAKNKETVKQIITQYQCYLKKFPECSIDNFCYTANVGRGHYNHRFAVIVESSDDFYHKNFDLDMLVYEDCFYREHKVVDTDRNLMPGHIFNNPKRELTEKATLLMKQAIDTYNTNEYRSLLREIIKLYMQGADVLWELLYKGRGCYKVSLPTYPFNHKHYWIDGKDQNAEIEVIRKTTKIHPLIDECILDTYQMQIYSTQMSINSCWELKCHKINGKNVLPGTAFIEMAQFACSQLLRSNIFEIQDLVYMIPLVCSENEVRTVHTIVKDEGSLLSLVCCSKSNDDEEWICHIELKVQKECKQNQFVLDTSKIINRCKKTDTSKLNKLSIVNIEGEKWSNLKQVYVNHDEILIEFQLNHLLNQEKDRYFLYPSLLDPAINGGNFILQSVHLPFSCKKARFYEELPEHFYSHIRRTDQINENNEFATFDIIFCTDDGRIIGEMKDYVIKKVHQPEFFMIDQKVPMKMFYETNWIEYEQDHTEALKHNISNDIMLVLYRTKQKNNPVLKLLEKRFGNSVIAIELAEKYYKVSETHYQIGNVQDDFDNLMRNLPKDKMKSIIQLTSFHNTSFLSADDLQLETLITLKSTFLLVKALLNNNVRQEINLNLLTIDANSVTGDELNINPLNRALIGMGSCIEDEYINIKTRAIDCDENTSADTIVEELAKGESMYSIAYRNGKRYVEQMDILKYSDQIYHEKLELKDNGVYIITGGIGGIALSICRYLFSVNKDITIILLNRTYSHDEFKEMINSDDALLQKKIDLINKLWSEGKQVKIIKVDVSKYNMMNETLQEIRKSYGQIHGIIHTAGVAGDGFIMKKEWNTFENVLKSKIYGTWILHELTLRDNLDFFVMCSSFASVFGAAGQSDYIASNAYLDSFTYYRQKLGYPSLTINWTGWHESGMAAANNVEEKNSYVRFVNDVEGANAFAYSLKTKLPRVLVGEINHSIFISEYSNFSRKLMLSKKIVDKEISSSKKLVNEMNINDVIITGKSIDKLTEIEKHVIYAWAETLGVNEVDIHAKFFESGGNSLLASYLHKELNKIYPGIMAITDVFVYSTIADIAAYISDKLSGNTKKQHIIEDDNEQDIQKLVAQFVEGDIDLDEIEKLLG